jgi:hypothetical protein
MSNDSNPREEAPGKEQPDWPWWIWLLVGVAGLSIWLGFKWLGTVIERFSDWLQDRLAGLLGWPVWIVAGLIAAVVAWFYVTFAVDAGDKGKSGAPSEAPSEEGPTQDTGKRPTT